MTYNKAGSVQAVLTRITRLQETGAPIVGANNVFYSDQLVEASFAPTYSEPDAIQQPNAAGNTCVFFQPDPSVQGLTIEGVKWCTPDPEVLEFLGGGTILTGTGSPAPAIGYAAPAVGSPASKTPVSLEFWSRAIIGGQPAGYFHWLLPYLRLKFSANWVLNGSDVTLPEFAGTGSENSQWLKGPLNDWPYTVSNRVFQMVQEATLPEDWEYGYTPALAPTP